MNPPFYITSVFFTLCFSCQSLYQSPYKTKPFPNAQNTTPKTWKHVGENTWRITSQAKDTYDDILRRVAQRYVIINQNKKKLQLQTDWDHFSIKGKLFRNRISAQVFQLNPWISEINLKNDVEQYLLLEGNLAQWIPITDITDEIQTLISSRG